MATSRGSRPKLDERYSRFIDINSLNYLINILEAAYLEDKNEKVFRAVNKLKDIKRNFWNMEASYREAELREFWENPGAFPHAVRVWIMELREQENA